MILCLFLAQSFIICESSVDFQSHYHSFCENVGSEKFFDFSSRVLARDNSISVDVSGDSLSLITERGLANHENWKIAGDCHVSKPIEEKSSKLIIIILN